MFSTLLLAVALTVSPAHAGKKKDTPPPPPPVVTAPAEPAPPALDAAPAIDAAFEADIRKLLVATGAGSMGVQMMDQMLTSLKPMAPQLPAAFWDGVKAEFQADELINLVVPIYARHLTHADVKELLAFYESPVGRKLVSVQPALMEESMAAGQVWGQEIAMRVVAKMQAQGQ